ncbi:MAG: hypothetical protein ACT4N4_09605 [Rhodospirillales bacterium]
MLVGLLRWVSFVSAALPMAAAAAHALETPNKLGLDGPLWLMVQQQLYAGWSPFTAAFLWTAFFAAWGLAVMTMGRFAVFLPTVVAALSISGALAMSVLFLGPLEAIFASWTPATMPANWQGFRLRWQLIQGLEFALFALAYLALLRAAFRDWCPAAAKK